MNTELPAELQQKDSYTNLIIAKASLICAQNEDWQWYSRKHDIYFLQTNEKQFKLTHKLTSQ